MDRPFRELHELYKILYERAEAQKKADEERQKKEEEEERARQKLKADENIAPYQIHREPPPDATKITPDDNIIPSPYEVEALEEVFEEMAEGGII